MLWIFILIASTSWGIQMSTHDICYYKEVDDCTGCNLKTTATDEAHFSSEKCWYLSYFLTKTYVVGTHLKRLGYFLMKTYVVGTHQKRLAEALLMSTHNICFCQEIRKILCGYLLLSVAMWRLRNYCALIGVYVVIRYIIEVCMYHANFKAIYGIH